MSNAVQRQQALAFIAALDGPDYDALASLMHENFTHRFLPATLGGFGKLVRTKEEFLDHVREVMVTFEKFNFLPPKDIFEGPDVIVIHLVTDGRTASGKPYNNEYLFNFRFEGDKILSIKEMMDSQYVTKMIAGEAQQA